MEEMGLYQRFKVVFEEMPEHLPEVPRHVVQNLNARLVLRPYQEMALRYLFYYLSDYRNRVRPSQLLFHMATGSGKTLIMAASMLYLYEQGYRDFVFFVNSTNIIQKTKDNFLNQSSSKYLFAPAVEIRGERVRIQPVQTFQGANRDAINILFTTIQGLHTRLNTPAENAVTYEDLAEHNIVLISDEAHHINALTKAKSRRTTTEADNLRTWEGTVDRVFGSNPENLMLEFTATAELGHEAVWDKYRDKLLYEYDLKQFRQDGYSKEVMTLEADLPDLDRVLQAMIVSQYRRKVAESHGVLVKPVVLLKSRFIYESREFAERFLEAVRSVDADWLGEVKAKSASPVIARAFAYFHRGGVSFENLAREISVEFGAEKCRVVDSQSISEETQLEVNSLEDRDNGVRLIFAVNQLNEGWDVLNLFDIVRLYNTRDARGGRPGPTTVSEAQLIGRGARYFPFRLHPGQEPYKRKYDEDLGNELRALEVLYYHSAQNPRYIQELHQALREEGMMPEYPARELHLKLKEEFKQSSFWEGGVLFANERVRNDNAEVLALRDAVTPPCYSYSLHTGRARETVILDEVEPGGGGGAEVRSSRYTLADLGEHVLRTALSRIKFYRFDNLRGYFPHLSSIREFTGSAEYLAGLQVEVTGTARQLARLGQEDRLCIALHVLRMLASSIATSTTTYTGSKEFKPHAIRDCLGDRTLNVFVRPGATTGPGIGMLETTDSRLQADLSREQWYVYNENYGTSEEKALVKFVQGQVAALRERYTDIYLLRNQKLFQLYTFSDGRPVEPDFVLFLTERRTGKRLAYQLFVESKGAHLLADDLWKEQFLKQIEPEHRITVEFRDRDYRLVGMPLYNEDLTRREFDEKFQSVLLPRTEG